MGLYPQQLQKYDKDRSWAEFQTSVPAEALALVQAVASTTVGNGKSTLFWEDRWLNGSRVCDIAPLVYDRIPPRIIRCMLVSDSVINNNWAGQIGPNLAPEVLLQFIDLWQRVTDVPITQNVIDVVKWS